MGLAEGGERRNQDSQREICMHLQNNSIFCSGSVVWCNWLPESLTLHSKLVRVLFSSTIAKYIHSCSLGKVSPKLGITYCVHITNVYYRCAN